MGTKVDRRSLALLIFAALGFTLGCDKKKLESESTDSAVGSGSIYLASGTAYAGLGVAMATPSNTIAKYDVAGNFVELLRDYTQTAGDTPASVKTLSDDQLVVLVENTASRRVESVAKTGTSFSNLFTGSGLTGVVRSMAFDYSGGLLISRSAAIEKYTLSGTRVMLGAASYVNAPGGACATMTNNLTAVVTGPDDQILVANAFTAASTNNKVAMIAKTGYAVVGDCMAALAAPTTNHFPTALLMHSSGHLLIAYGNNTGPIHQVYSTLVNSNSFGTAVQAYSDLSVLQGISAMAEMPDGSVLIASAAATFNTIERFTFNPTNGTLTRVGTRPFIGPTIFTRSIASMLVEP